MDAFIARCAVFRQVINRPASTQDHYQLAFNMEFRVIVLTSVALLTH
jgi:hypothetical protein